ncbi:MAG: DNA-3-methyladenine glycosylase 2 family protein [Lysobacterales bacterium]
MPAPVRKSTRKLAAAPAIPTSGARGYDQLAASAHLARVDPLLGWWIEHLGPLEPTWLDPFEPFDALARAILYQQLAGKAAATIVGRVERQLGGSRLTPDAMLAQSVEAIRACGVSGNKQLALRDLADKTLSGIVPRNEALDALDNEALIERLTTVRGIGRWTVEMLLLFRLGRADVLAIDDLGVRKGAQVLLAMPRRAATRKSPNAARLAATPMPTPRELAALGARWAPYRTHACRYLWRIADAVRAPAPNAKPIHRSQDAPT